MRAGELAALRRNLTRTFDYRCTVQRQVVTGQNPYGEDQSSGWQPVKTLACSFGQNTDAERFAPERDTVVRGYRALVPAGSDVRETDQIVDVRDADDALIEAGPLAITGLVSGAAIILTLERVR